jgi:hypothetical protein
MPVTFKIDMIEPWMVDIEIFDSDMENHTLLKLNNENGINHTYTAYVTYSNKGQPIIRFNLIEKVSTEEAKIALFTYTRTHREQFIKQALDYLSETYPDF